MTPTVTDTAAERVLLAEEESWRDVQDWEGFYDISNLGRLARIMPDGSRRIRRLGPPARKYIRVGLTRPGMRATASIHILVAHAFLGPCPEGHEVDHKDGCKTNNRASNLEYVTHPENMRRASVLGLTATHVRNGKHTHPEKVQRGDGHYSRLHPERLARGDRNGSRAHPERLARGERHGKKILTEAKVREIHRRLALGHVQVQIAADLNVSQAMISSVKRGLSWGHVK